MWTIVYMLWMELGTSGSLAAPDSGDKIICVKGILMAVRLA